MYVWYYAWIVFFFAWMFVTASCLTLRKRDMDDIWNGNEYFGNDNGNGNDNIHGNDDFLEEAPGRQDVAFDASHLRHGLQYIYFENAGN